LVSSHYFFGDESNQARLRRFQPAWILSVDKTFQVYARVDNILDNRYATTGAIPNSSNGGAPFTDPRSLSPARPRTFYAGLKVSF
jgi:outer membrane receptor protein involved in Fe transport